MGIAIAREIYADDYAVHADEKNSRDGEKLEDSSSKVSKM